MHVIGRAEFWGKVVFEDNDLRAEFGRAVEAFPYWPEVNYERLGVPIGPPLEDLLGHEVRSLS